ncbi:aminopeptidase [Herminiimonas fonticola]|uniref:Putative aminopeptidase n=1 Tax=Herminiimonas fonticola TaxID=303380 RepID=A0A4R6G5B9_9BURK|nr:aminopeptidase [Herminiimonas fonticola]RBA23126.1 putative aminopeptidase [Herminiimonas fonticola]TDN88845.1 putative aminopeptidase [Herminiimonas fonticola]
MRLPALTVLPKSGVPTLSACLCAMVLGGCAQLGYYAQATHGQSSLMAAAKPIDDLLLDPDVDGKLRQRLVKAKQIRQFAVSELGLPDNASYKSYADLQRPFALWNVVATPELSLRPLQWCFPVAGCISYRGYYSKDDAHAFAATLRADGHDVQVIGVPTYSTLGWFDDPVLSTFIRSPDGELARLIFHELAHQVVYVKDDTQFNESFATAVEEEGVERWFALHGDANAKRLYAEFKVRRGEFLGLLLRYRTELAINYAGIATDDEKRLRKVEIFAALQRAYQTLKVSWYGFAGYDRWFAEPLSNAHLASIATYHEFVPGFKALLREKENFANFYQAVIALAAENKLDRHRKLAALGTVIPVAIENNAGRLPAGN